MQAMVGINAVVLDDAEHSMLAGDSFLKGTRIAPSTLWAGRPAEEKGPYSEKTWKRYEEACERLAIFGTMKSIKDE